MIIVTIKNKGLSTNYPSLKTKIWLLKQCIIVFFESYPIDMLDMVEKGNYNVLWVGDQKQQYLLNKKA